MLQQARAENATIQRSVRNQVLCTLPPEDFNRLEPFLEHVELKKNTTIFEANGRADAVYFIEGGIVSRTTATSSDAPVEVATIGRFGFVGISVVLGSSEALHRSVVLVPGTAFRVGADDLRSVMGECPGIRNHLLRYVQILILLEAQLVLCNARHLQSSDKKASAALEGALKLVQRAYPGIKRPAKPVLAERELLIAASRARLAVSAYR